MIVNTQNGFTIIELMITVTILGILMSIAIPTYQDFIARAQVMDAVNSIAGLKADFTSSYSTTGVCPVNGVGGFGSPTSYEGKYISKIDFSGSLFYIPNSTCTLTATFKTSDISVYLNGKKIIITMSQTNSGASQWEVRQNITQGTVPPRLLPSTLR